MRIRIRFHGPDGLVGALYVALMTGGVAAIAALIAGILSAIFPGYITFTLASIILAIVSGFFSVIFQSVGGIGIAAPPAGLSFIFFYFLSIKVFSEPAFNPAIMMAILNVVYIITVVAGLTYSDEAHCLVDGVDLAMGVEWTSTLWNCVEIVY